jgi:hypothetical protein
VSGTQPPKLQFLHQSSSLIPGKLEEFPKVSTETLRSSLMPGQRDSLKTRRDGTVLDGRHRIVILLERGEDVDQLPREIIEKEDDS